MDQCIAIEKGGGQRMNIEGEREWGGEIVGMEHN